MNIKIEYMGLRLLEKLYEEKLMAEEVLMNAAYANQSDIRALVMDTVSTYHLEDGQPGEKKESV